MRTVATRPRPARSGARRLGAVASLALVSVLAVGCGDDGDDDGGSGSDGGDSGATVLSEDQLSTATISIDNLGDGWAEEPSEEDEGTAPGCLGEIDQITEAVEPAAEVDKTYGYGEQGLPQIDSGASSFDDQDTLTSTFDEVQEAFGSCTTVQGTDDEGTAYDLTLTYSDAISGEDVDDQVNLVAAGTLTTGEGQEIDVSLHVTMVRVANNVATIATTSLTDATTSHTAWAQIGIDRLVAVVNGEEPAETTAPAPA